MNLSNLKCLPFILLLLLSGPVLALDFLIGNQVNPLAAKGYKVQSRDTFGGYSIYAPEGDWSIYAHAGGNATGGTARTDMPSVGLERYSGGKWMMGQWITITTSSANWAGWEGDPCAGSKIIKINVVRGQLDRCATAEIQNIRLGSNPTDTLKITFIETNTGGRFYRVIFHVHYENLGYNHRVVTDQSSEFNIRLKDWMGKFLDGVIKAAGYDKPNDAFNGVPNFIDAINNSKSISGVSSSAPLRLDGPNLNGKNIQDRLQNLKDLFEKKLITEDDYDKKRKEILNSF